MKRVRWEWMVLAVWMLAGNSYGQTEYTWINSAGGDYGVGASWSPEGVPGLSDTVIFNLPDAYMVTWDDAYQVFQVRAEGGLVNWNLNGNSYFAEYGGDENDPAVMANGELEVGGGDAHSGAMTIGHSVGDTGILRIATGGFWETLLPATGWYPLVIGREGHGELHVASDATMRHGHGWAAMAPGSRADVTVDGFNAQWYVDGMFWLGQHGTANVTASNEGFIRMGRCIAAMQSDANTQVNVQSDSVWDLYSQPNEVSLMLGYYGSASLSISGKSMMYCSDHLNVAGFPGSYGRLIVSEENTHLNIGKDFMVGGHSPIPTDGDPIPAGPGGLAQVEIRDMAQISVNQSVTIYPTGSVTLDHGLFSMAGLDVQGTLSGKGWIYGSVMNEGSVIAGKPMEPLVILEDYVQSSRGVYTVQIGGTDPSHVGHIDALGTATLDGMLQVSLVNGFVPDPTDSFVIFTADMGLSGHFINAVSKHIGPYGTFDAAYAGNQVILSNYHSTPACMTTPRSDLNGDCAVNLLDLAILAGEWLSDGISP